MVRSLYFEVKMIQVKLPGRDIVRYEPELEDRSAGDGDELKSPMLFSQLSVSKEEVLEWALLQDRVSPTWF